MTHHSTSTGLWTAKQLKMLFEAWGFPRAKLPKKGKRLVLVFPRTFKLRIGLVTVHSGKSTDGKTLYAAELTDDNKPIAAIAED